jgi:hypothetical protein
MLSFKREENVSSFSLSSDREREKKRESKSYPLHLKQINLISFLLLHFIYTQEQERENKTIYCTEKNFRCSLLPKEFNLYVNLKQTISIVDAYRMLSIVIIILLIQQFYPTYQLEAVQAAISSTVELPCSVINQNIESTNPAKVNTKKGGKCL